MIRQRPTIFVFFIGTASNPAAHDASPSLSFLHRLRCLSCIELLGIELTGPCNEFVVLFVLGIGDGFEELGVAPNPAHVFRWAGTPAFDTHWITTTFLGTETSLTNHLVLPVVTEVVFVDKPKSLAVLGDSPPIPSSTGTHEQRHQDLP
ncbi:MAG: hypothetical protein R3C59_16505 [Planctomycetaceae bacterium]